MRKFLLLIFMVAFSGMGGVFAENTASPILLVPTARALSLEQVSDLALENSLDIQIAKFDLYIAKTDILKAYSIFDAFLDFGLSYTDDGNKPASSLLGTTTKTNEYSAQFSKKFSTGTTFTADIADTRVHSDSSFASINPYHESSAGITLNQELGKNFFGLTDRSQVKKVHLDVLRSEYVVLDDIETSLQQVQAAYWNLALKDQILKIRQDMLGRAQELYAIYQEKSELGLAEKVDLLAVRANLKVRENGVLEAQLNRQTAKNDLLFLLNINDLSVDLVAQDRLEMVPQMVGVYDALRVAIIQRRDYQKVFLDIRNAGLDVEIKRNALWPEVDLNASFTRNGLEGKSSRSWSEVGSEDYSEVKVGFNVKIPLNNREAKAERAQAELTKEQLLLKLKRTERLVLREINNKVNRVNTSASRIDLFSELLKVQGDKLQEERNRLAWGRSSSDIIIRYENDYLEARMSYFKAFFDYRVSLLDLELAQNNLLGRYWEGEL
jgi:outer membrane protein